MKAGETMQGKDLWYKLGVLAYLTAWYVGCFWMMGIVRSGWVMELFGVNFNMVEEYVYYGLAGSIGGTLYALRLFHDYYHNLTERWLFWYLLRPIKCGGAAIMTIILFQSGILLLQTGDSMISKIGISFLVGFGYGKVMEKLQSLTEALFNGNKNKASVPGQPSPIQPESNDDTTPKG